MKPDPLHSVLDSIEDAVLVTNAKGQIVFLNKQALLLSQEVLEKPLNLGDELVQAATKSQKKIIQGILLELRQKKHPVKSFAQLTSHKGHQFYLEFTHTPIFDEKGNLCYVQNFVRDNTPQKIFEQKLTAQAAGISELIDKANAIIIGIDTRGYITDWNIHCQQVTGYSKNEVYTRKFTDVLLKASETEKFQLLMDCAFNNETVKNYEIPVLTKENQTAVLLLSSTLRTSPSGSVKGLILVGQDVTELNEYKTSLEKKVLERTQEVKAVLKKEQEVVEMKSRFVSIASHEFRTPLSSIQHATTYIKKNNQRITQVDLHDKLRDIDKQIKYMTHLLDDILTYGKSEAGKIQLVLSTINLRSFTTKLIEDAEHATRNTHKVILQIDEYPNFILSDEKLLRSVILNLLTNAIKFSPGRQYVQLTIHGNPRAIVFTVRDQGIGIPKEESEKIFEPFLRGKNVSAIQGTGLGLSIVKKSVELLDGTLHLTSEVGQGTTFRVTLPFKSQ